MHPKSGSVSLFAHTLEMLQVCNLHPFDLFIGAKKERKAHKIKNGKEEKESSTFERLMRGKQGGKRTDSWSREEVGALLQAWRDALEHPHAHKHTTLSSYIYERFVALRHGCEPLRTEVSVMYKKKVWRYITLFICEFGTAEWFKLSRARREARFNKHKTSTYNFVDLEHDIVDAVTKLIALEGSQPGIKRGGSGIWRRRRGQAATLNAASPASPLPPSTVTDAKVKSSIFDRVPGPYTAGGVMIDGIGGDGSESSTDSEEEDAYDPVASFFPAGPEHYGRREAPNLKPELIEIIKKVQNQTRNLKMMMDQTSEERQRAYEHRDECMQQQRIEEEKMNQILGQLKRDEEERLEERGARRREHDEWAQLWEELQLDQKERAKESEESERDREARHKLLESIKLEQGERQRNRDERSSEREETARLLEELQRDQGEREQDRVELDSFVKQIQLDQEERQNGRGERRSFVEQMEHRGDGEQESESARAGTLVAKQGSQTERTAKRKVSELANGSASKVRSASTQDLRPVDAKREKQLEQEHIGRWSRPRRRR